VREVGRHFDGVLVDAHAHLPMHLRPRGDDGIRAALASREGRFRLLERIDNWFLTLGERLFNRRSFLAGPRVSVPLLREGGVDVVLSVLYLPFYEGDLVGLVEPRYGRPCSAECFKGLLRQMSGVERRVETDFADEAVVARTWADVEAALDDHMLAVVHCVEGGFHLGEDEESVERNVGELARRGVAYITLAHLFWRGFATCEPAIPALGDAGYRRLFPQPPIGLSPLGRAAVRAMVRERVLIDLTHMSDAARRDTFQLLDELDPGGSVPVLASHAGFRLGSSTYNLDAGTARRIAERGGVIGLIVGERLIRDGEAPAPKSLNASVDLLCRHIESLVEATGSFENIGIGSDLDGFIKPLSGLDDAGHLRALVAPLQERYGQEKARQILGGNVLSLLRGYWGRGGTAP
jgi:microsomal dipeptidase-like Zn-dependent dipeptidase